MWRAWWKRFWVTQLLIAGVCAVLRFHFGRDWAHVGIFFGAMQLGGILGAWWGHRLGKQIEQSEDRLPRD